MTNEDFSVRRWVGGLAITLALLVCVGPTVYAQASDKPILNTQQDLWKYFESCMRPAGGAEGAEMTIRFSLKRDGSLLGKPRVTFSKWAGDSEDQRRFAEGIAAAFSRCLPAPITSGLGGALAGRPLSLRFVIQAPATNI